MTTQVFSREAWLAKIAKHVKACGTCRHRVKWNAGVQLRYPPRLCLRWLGLQLGLRACALVRMA